MNRLAALALAAFTGIAGASDSAAAIGGSAYEQDNYVAIPTRRELCRNARTTHGAFLNCVSPLTALANSIDRRPFSQDTLSPGQEGGAGHGGKEGRLEEKWLAFRAGLPSCQTAKDLELKFTGFFFAPGEQKDSPPKRTLTPEEKTLLARYTKNPAVCSGQMAEFWDGQSGLSAKATANDLRTLAGNMEWVERGP